MGAEGQPSSGKIEGDATGYSGRTIFVTSDIRFPQMVKKGECHAKKWVPKPRDSVSVARAPKKEMWCST